MPYFDLNLLFDVVIWCFITVLCFCWGCSLIFPSHIVWCCYLMFYHFTTVVVFLLWLFFDILLPYCLMLPLFVVWCCYLMFCHCCFVFLLWLFFDVPLSYCLMMPLFVVWCFFVLWCFSFVFPLCFCDFSRFIWCLSSVYFSSCNRSKFLLLFDVSLSATSPSSAYEVQGVWCTFFFRCFPYPKV